MIRQVDNNYGADADGNRGTTTVFYELDDSDEPELISQIIEYIESTGEFPDDNFTVRLIDPVSEDDVDFEINPVDYLSNEQMTNILATCED